MAILFDRYDIVICGAGLAGLTLALQLRRELPEQSILILEKKAEPLPLGTHKVGESTTEGGTHLLRRLAGLGQYVESTHIKKLGLRFFGAGLRKEGFDKRFEIGDVVFARNSSYQVDRGILEKDLRQFCRDAGVPIEEGVSVRDIEFGPEANTVTFARLGEGATSTVSCRWVIDGMGRRRFLQSKLGTIKNSAHKGSACWWRVSRDFDVAEMVSRENELWHDRVFAKRWASTNHLLGPGYFIWIIPLCSGMTSIGIVGDEDVHPVRDRNSFEKALAWLSEHEPSLFKAMENEKPLDFLVLKNFAYTTEKAFSTDRWTCIGEAAVFTDPLYSMGADQIAITNRITVRMIQLDAANQLTGEIVELYNKLFLGVVDVMTELFSGAYPVFGNDDLAILKVMWDVASYWGFFSQLSIQDVLYRHESLPQLIALSERLRVANTKVQAAFRGAARTANGNKSIKTGFYNFGGVSRVTDLRAKVTDKRGIPEMTANMDFLEEFATAMCSFVVTDQTAAELPLTENLRAYLRPVERVSFT